MVAEASRGQGGTSLNLKILFYSGALGAVLAILGALISQGLSSGLFVGSANISSAFASGQDPEEAAEALKEALPKVEEHIAGIWPFVLVQLSGYFLFSLGFAGVWRMTRRSLAFIACLCFILTGAMTAASYLIVPSAIRGLIEVLESGNATDLAAGQMAPSLIVLATAGVLGLIGLLAGAVSGGYEIHRVGRELDHDFMRGSGVLMMAGAVLSLIPLFGGLLVYISILSVGICFILLVRTLTAPWVQS